LLRIAKTHIVNGCILLAAGFVFVTAGPEALEEVQHAEVVR